MKERRKTNIIVKEGDKIKKGRVEGIGKGKKEADARGGEEEKDNRLIKYGNKIAKGNNMLLI